VAVTRVRKQSHQAHFIIANFIPQDKTPVLGSDWCPALTVHRAHSVAVTKHL